MKLINVNRNLFVVIFNIVRTIQSPPHNSYQKADWSEQKLKGLAAHLEFVCANRFKYSSYCAQIYNMPPSFPIKYTRLCLADAVPCRDLFRSTFAYSEWHNWSSAWRHRSSRGCWVARYRGAVVGVSLVSKDNVIKYIAIDPEYQGYKIGSVLLKLVLADLVDARSVRLTTAGDMRLLTWYGRFGFRAYEIVYNDDGEFIGAHMVRRARCRSSTAV
jgi:GNAT superfamily N-acetyltransferase